MTEDGIRTGSSRHFLKRIAKAIVEKSNTEEAFLKRFLGKSKSLIHFFNEKAVFARNTAFFYPYLYIKLYTSIP
ncbi:hypothetical protein AAG747_27985 [Rapidithrix thailandica]|uniref:Uncharacterized protein n=1 Tax=Rapidithrix thailandica TaxID=413964 RepID=A0AAW9SH44_9BACT